MGPVPGGFCTVHTSCQLWQADAGREHPRVLDGMVGAKLTAQTQAQVRQPREEPRVARISVAVAVAVAFDPRVEAVGEGAIPAAAVAVAAAAAAAGFVSVAKEHRVVTTVALPRGGLQVGLQRAHGLGRQGVALKDSRQLQRNAQRGGRHLLRHFLGDAPRLLQPLVNAVQIRSGMQKLGL